MALLENETEKPSSFWDWVIGIGLLLIVGGFTLFYQLEKKSSRARFAEADRLFAAGRLPEAAHLYEDLKSAQYLTPANDSVLYARLDSIESLREVQTEAMRQARLSLGSGDTAAARASFGRIAEPRLLSPEDSAFWAGTAPLRQAQ